MKNLYVNGCSFSAGNTLPQEQTWPYKLAQLNNLKVYNEAVNSQSMYNICYNTTMHLNEFDPKDTLVIIGWTWPERRSLKIDEGILSINLNDLGKEAVNSFQDKFSAYKKLSSPYFTSTDNQDRLHALSDTIRNNDKNLDIFTATKNAYKAQLLDDKFIEHRISEYFFNIYNLENYLKANKFRYKFICFQENIDNNPISVKLRRKIDGKNVIDCFINKTKPFCDSPSYLSHPSELHCTQLAELINEKLQQ